MKRTAGGRSPRSRGAATHRWVALGLFAAVAGPAAAQDPPAWTRPIAPFRIVGSIYYVGTEGLAAYLIKTPKGAILLDGTMAENVPAIERNIRRLGVPLRSVKYLLLTHAHFDHAAGLAGLHRDTGAPGMVGARERDAMRSGHPPGETTYTPVDFPAVPGARGIADGASVSVGGITMTAIATPGHTPGCTSWTTRVVEAGKSLRIVFPCSLSVAGNRLVGNRRYPGIVADYRASMARLGAMPADVVLPAHPEFADVLQRKARRDAGDARAFVDTTQLPRLVAKAKSDFAAEVTRQGRDVQRQR